MIQAFAPRLPRGCSWVMLVILGLSCLEPTAWGQSDPQPAPVAAPVAKPDDEARTAKKLQRFMDPNAKKTLSIFDPLFYRGKEFKTEGAGNDRSKMLNIASGAENEDPAFIREYVNYFTAQLSSRDNINALLGLPANLSPTAPAARGMERAVDALTRPLIDARANRKTTFLANYSKALFDSALPKLMTNNYFSRINAAIVLGMAGGKTPPALDFYANQLKTADQVIWVKMWAARGYTNASENGRRPIEFGKAINGAEALVEFLNSDPKLPYFVQFRALEALGALRVGVVRNASTNLDAASVIAGYLADPSAHPETRAYAAWALGMVKVPPQVTPYNLSLAGNEIGELAADLGQLIVAEYDAHAERFAQEQDDANSLTALLLFQVVPAVIGEEGMPDSGLLKANHPDAAAAKPFLTKLDDKVRGLTREAYELLRIDTANQKNKRNSLEARVTELRAFLNTNQPTDRHLVPNGPLFAAGPNGL